LRILNFNADDMEVYMRTSILFVRHGETEWNILGKYQGCTDIELTSNGISQARLLKDRLRGNFDYIYTSPLKRAKETANIICENYNIKPVIEHSLREVNFGDWEGLTLKEIQDRFPEQFGLWRSDELDGPLCGGDLSIKLASKRAKEGILRIAKEHKGKKIVIVCHGGIIKAGLIGIFDWKMTMFHKFFLGNTSISELHFDENLTPFLSTLNDTNHLKNLLS
jgi:probable phosphoglycerate mutase